MNNNSLRALIIEDSEPDARLLVRELTKGGYAVHSRRVETAEALRQALAAESWDSVFCDYGLPQFNGREALSIVRSAGLDVPFIFVSGTMGEEVAVAAMKAGAQDYVMKNNLARLVPALDRELRDAAERRAGRRAEEAMRNSEFKYRHLFESLSDAAFLIDKNTGRIIDTNRQAEILLDRQRWEILGSTQVQIFPVEDLASLLFDAPEQGLRRECETQVQRRNASLVSVLVSGSEIQLYGHHLWLLLVRDITERRQSEEQLRKLSRAVEQSPASIMITDRAGNIEYVNPRFCKVTGYTAGEAVGKTPRLLKSGTTPPDVYRQLWETIEAGGEWRGELQNKRKNGELYYETVSISPVVDASGNISHYVAVKEDITEKKQLEAQFLRAQRLESIGQLAGGIAHDLNNILAPVMMCAGMLREEVHSPTGLSMLDTIEGSARRGAEIVKQVLTFARGVEGQRLSLQPAKLIREMAHIIRETFPKSIQFKVELPGDLWRIMGDATQLHQVLLNLTVNARDAMPDGGLLALSVENTILDAARARLMPGAKPGLYALLKISDTGTGIPPEIADKIFDPFFTTKVEDKGTGLGLSTVLGIVKSHGGFIQFHSRPGRGTTFEVYLPAQTTDEPGRREAPVEALLQGNNELILVVDDEPGIRSTTRLVLQTNGYRVVMAGNGAEALALYAGKPGQIDLVLTDLNMPGLSGSDTIAGLQRINPAARIVVTTGADSAGGNAAPLRFNVAGCLHKPFDATTLLNTLHRVLHSGAPGPSTCSAAPQCEIPAA